MNLTESNPTVVALASDGLVSSAPDEKCSNSNTLVADGQPCTAEDPAIPDHSFGKHLQEARLSKKLTVRQLAAKAKISYAELSRIENGKPPTASTLRKLSPYLSIPFDMLLTDAGYSFRIDSSPPVYLDLMGEEVNLTEKALNVYKRNVEFFFQLDAWIQNCSDQEIELTSQFLFILNKKRELEQEPDSSREGENPFQKIFTGLLSLIQACSTV